MICVIHPTGVDPATLRAIRAGAGGQQVRAHTRITDADADSTGIFCHHSAAEQVLAATPGTPMVVMADHADPGLLELVLAHPMVIGLATPARSTYRRHELTYLARRLAAPTKAGPELGMMLGWGATSILFRPSNTRELREVGEKIETVCTKLGVKRKESGTVAHAAHELLMNAVYDAPQQDGRPKYALDRSAEIQLEPAEVPDLRLTVNGDYVALDMTDPNGTLKRRRFFEGVLRGIRNHIEGEAIHLDTSHGGAGLGLHTLYSSACWLRAEVSPGERTLVSWMMARDEGSCDGRSLYFLTTVDPQPIELEAEDLVA